MSLLGSLLDRIFGLFKTEYYSAMKTDSGVETLDGTDDKDKIAISGSVKSTDSGVNEIALGDGSDKLTIYGRLESENSNTIDMGEGGSTLRVVGSVLATESGTNEITAGSDNDVVRIAGVLKAEDTASNDIHLGEGDNTISVALGMSARDDGANNINAGDGDDAVCITAGIYSEGSNAIDVGNGDNQISVRGGMYADGGEILLTTGSGDDSVFINGMVKTSDGGSIEIQTGAGNDVICLNGTVDSDSFTVDAGMGDDTLVLNASRVATFNRYYEDWLTDVADNGGLDSLNVETIEVKLGSTRGGLSDLEWLGEQAELAGIDLQLNINGAGRNIKLGDFFENDEADVFNVLSMTGGIKNTLTIKGSLDDNGYDSNELVILGDSKDTVKIDKAEWTEVKGGDTFHDFDVRVFSNDEGQSLLIQSELNVIFSS